MLLLSCKAARLLVGKSSLPGYPCPLWRDLLCSCFNRCNAAVTCHFATHLRQCSAFAQLRQTRRVFVEHLRAATCAPKPLMSAVHPGSLVRTFLQHITLSTMLRAFILLRTALATLS